jgi:SAM-dependent methyltransferase
VKLDPGQAPERFRESLATTYDNHASERDERGEAEWRWPLAEAFLGRLGIGDRLLEIGAGTGFTARWFADAGLRVVATDLSPAQVERCRAKGLEAHARDMYDLGFPVGSFEAVWAMNCLLHAPNRDLHEVLMGIHRVLVPGGLFHLGLWGGVDEEGIYEDDFYLPPRFFSFRSDDEIQRRVREVFNIVSFEALDPETTDDRLHMQSLVARRVG